ncbi:hypothetical protein LXJ56_30840, partial [Escherichia coli]|nr:hypothetical protein [Escherichia coli]
RHTDLDLRAAFAQTGARLFRRRPSRIDSLSAPKTPGELIAQANTHCPIRVREEGVAPVEIILAEAVDGRALLRLLDQDAGLRLVLQRRQPLELRM